jgi:hypothetical protein
VLSYITQRCLWPDLICITHSEHVIDKRRAAASEFPLLVPATSALGLEVFHLGFHSPDSFGATAWLVRNPATGVAAMVDSPRYSTGLRKAMERRLGAGMVGLFRLLTPLSRHQASPVVFFHQARRLDLVCNLLSMFLYILNVLSRENGVSLIRLWSWARRSKAVVIAMLMM